MNYTLEPIVLTEHQVRQQLTALGYQTGDRVWLRLLKAKNMPLAEQLQRGLAWEREPGKTFEIAIDGYLTIGAEKLTFTRLTRDPKTGEKTQERGYPFRWLLQQNTKGYGVYLVVNPGGREDAEITKCRSLFYECDGISKDEQWAKLRSLETLLGRKATLVIETRNSLHCYFALNEPLTPEDFRQYQQRLIQQQDSDPAIFNPARLMRLAGFDHQKWNVETESLEATPVRFVQASASTFSASDFDYLLPAWDPSRWEKKANSDRANGSPSDATDNPYDIRNFASYLEGGSSRRRGWDCYKCPVHEGVSDDSLHIESASGAFKCHAGCDSKAVYDATLKLAQARGYQIPAGAKRQGKSKASKLPSYALTYAPDVVSSSRYLGNVAIPDAAKLVCIKAPKGCGKTELIAAIVDEATRNGQRTWVITYREQLGVQLARRFGLPYKTEVRRSQEGKLLGYVCCIDSLHPRAEVPFSADGTENDLVIIDECESVTWHTLDSSTCGKQRVSILQEFAPLLEGVLDPGSKGRCILADADLSDLAVDFVRGMGGRKDLKPFVIESIYKPSRGWAVYSYEEATDLLHTMKADIAMGGKHLILTTGQKASSKWSSQNLERELKRAFPDKRILRIDSHTIADPSHPAFGCLSKNLTIFLAEYDLVLCSPTLESGVSLDLHDHFAGVWGFFSGIAPENSVRQFLARLRDNNVTRHLYVAERGINTAFIGNGATEAKALLECENQKATLNRRAIQNASTTVDEEGNVAFNSVPLETWGRMGARINLGLANYRAAVLAGLEAEGHTIHDGTALSKDERVCISEEMGAIRDENHQIEAAAIAAATPPETEAEYEALKTQKTKTAAERYAQRHYELERRYAVEVTSERVLQDDAGWHPGVQLQYYLTCGHAYLPERDKKRFEAIADLAGVAFTPDVNKNLLGVKVGTLKALGIDQLLVEGVEFSKHHPIVVGIMEKLLDHQKAVKDALGVALDAKPTDTSMGLIQDLLRATLGIALKRTGQRGPKGDRYYVYEYIPGYVKTDRETKEDVIDDRMDIFAAWLQRDTAQAEKTGKAEQDTRPITSPLPEPTKADSVRDAYEKPNRSYKAFDMSAQTDMHSPGSNTLAVCDSTPHPVREWQGFRVGDSVQVVIDHVSDEVQERMTQLKELPVGAVGVIDHFQPVGYLPDLTVYHSVLLVNGEWVRVPIPYLRHWASVTPQNRYPATFIPESQTLSPGSQVKWGTRLGEWVVEAVDGTTARVRAAAGWAGGMVWNASVDDLRAVA